MSIKLIIASITGLGTVGGVSFGTYCYYNCNSKTKKTNIEIEGATSEEKNTTISETSKAQDALSTTPLVGAAKQVSPPKNT